MTPKKNPHAVALGKKGGKARMESLTKEQKTELARKAILIRWEQYREKKAATLNP